MSCGEPDFTFSNDGLFVHLMPNNAEAQSAWRTIAAVFESGVVPLSAWQAVRLQLRAAGYSVHKRRPVSGRDDQALLAELRQEGD